MENSFIAYGKVSIRYSGVFQRGCEEYKACAKLISGLVDCSIRTTTYLIMNGVLIYAVLCAAVVIGEDDVGVERLLPSEDVRVRCKAHSYQRISRDRERERERERDRVSPYLYFSGRAWCASMLSHRAGVARGANGIRATSASQNAACFPKDKNRAFDYVTLRQEAGAVMRSACCRHRRQ